MIRQPHAIMLCLTAALLGGCATTNLHALRDELLETDRAWARAATGDDVERIASFWTDDAVIYLAGRPPVEGKEALTAMVEKGRATDGFSIHWETFDAVVARSGDLAHTLAHYTITAPRPDGTLITQRGTSICAWRREHGQWRCTLEVHAPLGPPPTSPP